MIRIVLLSFALQTSSSPADRWWGPDKVKHFAVGTFTQSLGYGTARLLGGTESASIVAATAATGSLALWKERRDRRLGGTASARDLVWTLGGAAAVSPLLLRSR